MESYQVRHGTHEPTASHLTPQSYKPRTTLGLGSEPRLGERKLNKEGVVQRVLLCSEITGSVQIYELKEGSEILY